MGYESKLYIVEKYSSFSGEKRKFARDIACFDLAKAGLEDIVKTYPITDCYIYADDGNTPILEDKYGDPLREIPVADMIRILTDMIKENGYYRRYISCIALLSSFLADEWKDVVVLHYGH